MKQILFFLTIVLIANLSTAQTKVSGYVYDEFNYPVPYANVVFKGSSVGTITDENGKFYLEDDSTWKTLKISFISYKTKVIALEKRITYDLKILLKEDVAKLDAVVITSGKQSKKNNPAIDILRKIWENKRSNGLKRYKQYEYDKYEKVEFDLNTIDSAVMKSRLFRGIEFVFNQVDTSSVTGNTYLPIFINEAASKVYGDNTINKKREVLKGNKNSGFSNNQFIIDFIDDLYSDYDIYNNYLKFFDKSFTSPISRTGINTYNYVLADSSFIDNKWCYNIVYYPRRKNELTFKGDFWVADTTFAIKDINMQASKSANINWVKDIYIEQEFDVLNDSIILLKRDYFLSDFALNKKEKSKGIYGKRTTIYDNYKFNIPKEKKFFNEKVYSVDESLYNQNEAFWKENRMEALSKDEKGVYTMLDTLKQTKKFKRLYTLGTILTSNYIEIPSLKMDYGPVLSTIGFNEVEGLRLRLGGRTYFGPNDMWRIQGFGAYGFKDKNFKYGISAKWLLNKKSRFIISGGKRLDVEQIGSSLTTSTDIFGRGLIQSSIFGSGTNDRLTKVNLTNLALEVEPVKNLLFRLSSTHKTLESASETFNLDYFTDASRTTTNAQTKQLESTFTISYFPNRELTGYGVERRSKNSDFARLFAHFTYADKDLLNSDFTYKRLQFAYTQPFLLGAFGRLTSTIETGKTFGQVPLSLLSIIPGNQTFFSSSNTFSNLRYYEFVSDQYATLHLEHNFNGRLFSRIPFIKKYKLRAIASFRAVIADVSQENIAINASNLTYLSPNKEPYYEYGFSIGNIFKILRIDFNFRGNYLDQPNVERFRITGSFGFHF